MPLLTHVTSFNHCKNIRWKELSNSCYTKRGLPEVIEVICKKKKKYLPFHTIGFVRHQAAREEFVDHIRRVSHIRRAPPLSPSL